MSSKPASVLPERRRERLLTGVTTVGDRDSLDVRSPITGESVGTVPSCTAEDVAAAVEGAKAAQAEWAATPVAERADVLRRFADAVTADRSDLLDVVQVETGKARFDALEEVLDLVATADYYAREGPGHIEATRRTGAVPGLTRAVEHADPVGVVGCISPWNYPLTLAVSDLLPALLAGNGAVLKPAEATPFSALHAVELLESAGLPEDLLQVVTGDGERLGEPLISRVDHLRFTGSTAVGREVAALAGRHLVDVSLELGGKNPAVVLDDADLSKTVRGLVNGCYANAGQLCIATERVYVGRSRFDEFRERFVAATECQSLGVGLDWGPDVGSLIGEDQLDTVDSHVADARERGATVETGGKRREDVGPWVYEPTVLTDLPDRATAASQETFGPVVSLVPVDGVDEAVERANDTDYGLHASVWTGDAERGERVARRIDAGTVSVNDGYRAMWASTDAPMGGVGDSGIGRRHGPEGIRDYTDSRTVVTQRGHPLAFPDAVPNRVAAAAATATLGPLRWLRDRSPPGPWGE
ncbi:succinic semialdehyde dehydrogenase [Halosimplex carlsbadense 2-9-1]|uniref:Succinic semialdehyde dehydrogenase n=1 Tax=Halosimplex carlsbadense 2-9-1 TaxID=797114 RepID=M0CSJ4_9EURY|nr:succinic semialdehyde dehydrogenase [Halosimplex carlsbadense]ELZ24849.1 succinic semialdehyde dehydrogenase [Halosimplex carlsbadense 2-9-1]